jgi:superfamily II DNA/RNA helicase
VLIATPGRLLDLIDRGKILLSDSKLLVIDEADRMLDMGFIPDVERIVSFIPKIRQTLFFSATMPPEIRRLADAFLMNPKEISVAPPASPAELVAQALLVVDPVDKRETLRRLLRNEDVKNALIFCNRKRDVDMLHRSLAKHGFDVAALHGDMPQSKRTETLERFRKSEIRLLVASDVAARGLDIQGLSHVFNFDVPHHAEDYVHRIGRTGRAGRDGRAYTIATPEDGKAVAAIEELIRKAIPRSNLDDVPAQELSLEETDHRRSRGRNGRGRERQGSEKPAKRERRRDERPRAPAPRPTQTEAPRLASPRLAQSRPVRPEDGLESAEAGAVITPIALAAHREGARPHRDGESDSRVVGFGDHLPAFLRRPVRVAGA